MVKSNDVSEKVGGLVLLDKTLEEDSSIIDVNKDVLRTVISKNLNHSSSYVRYRAIELLLHNKSLVPFFMKKFKTNYPMRRRIQQLNSNLAKLSNKEKKAKDRIKRVKNTVG
ncbi:MAG: hypothetical protein H6577_04250 [Lewinellaceae bacterium]|nr:hypothetical protein [Lewinellaceae bacterium]